MNLEDTSSHDIAIIGMAGRFPGAENIEKFWQNIVEGVESVRFFSDEQLIKSGISPAYLKNKNYVKAKGYLSGATLFDAEFFNVHEHEAKQLDPQFRLFLEVSWAALENSGYDPEQFSGKIGLFAGSSSSGSSYNQSQYINQKTSPIHQVSALTYQAKDFLTSLVGYRLNLTGPCVTVQTACSTSLVAITTACESLLNSSSDIALAGGICITTPLKSGYFYQDGMILSENGHCRAFDEDATGTVPGDGVGIVVLKKLERAVKDKDNIHAIIKGFAVNNDGNDKIGFTAPSIAGQCNVIVSALEKAQISQDKISYIETHGTGTYLGDPIEISALSDVFNSTNVKAEQSITLGTLKPNIGHLDAASGVASIVKTVQALKHKILPPSINFSKLNNAVSFNSTPFTINTASKTWEVGSEKRYAGVSSFGIGGTNAHIVLSEWTGPLSEGKTDFPVLLVLSAKKRSTLIRKRRQLALYIEKSKSSSLNDIAFTLQVGRKNMKERFACICYSKDDAMEKLTCLSEQIMIGVSELETQNSEHYKQLCCVAKKWHSGELIDWYFQNKDSELKRIALPTYPFESREFWIEEEFIDDFVDELTTHENEVTKKALEETIKDIFKSFLGVEKVSSVDDFYDLGGDSLLILQVVEEIKKKLGVILSASAVETFSTPKELAEHIKNELMLKDRENGK